MFSGIIEELGQLQAVQPGKGYVRLQVQASKVLQDLQVGDSIAINGVCQTLEQRDTSGFTVAAFAETLAKTNLGQLQCGASLNLERAITPSTRLGGHMVQGHVDAMGYLQEIRQEQDNRYLRIALPQNLLDLCVLHGSICIDGVSLTIARLHEDGIEVNIIAHTWQHTRFGHCNPGDALNIECDILGKYMLRFAQRHLIGHNQ